MEEKVGRGAVGRRRWTRRPVRVTFGAGAARPVAAPATGFEGGGGAMRTKARPQGGGSRAREGPIRAAAAGKARRHLALSDSLRGGGGHVRRWENLSDGAERRDSL